MRLVKLGTSYRNLTLAEIEVCSTNHDAVAFYGYCPACKLYKEKEAAEDLAEERLEEIDELKDKIEELEEKLDSLNLGG